MIETKKVNVKGCKKNQKYLELGIDFFDKYKDNLEEKLQWRLDNSINHQNERTKNLLIEICMMVSPEEAQKGAEYFMYEGTEIIKPREVNVESCIKNHKKIGIQSSIFEKYEHDPFGLRLEAKKLFQQFLDDWIKKNNENTKGILRERDIMTSPPEYKPSESIT